MASICLHLTHKKNRNELLTYTQETNTTEKIDDKTKSSVIQQQQNANNKKYRNNYYLKRYENYFNKKLVIKYNVLPQEYNFIQLDNFITAKYCHHLASFKENLIYNDTEEFLRRYYVINESTKKIPLFSEFYKSYLNFFCFPTFAELKLNDLIEDMVEDKAKAFYNENYKEEEEKDSKKSKNNINSIIFTQKIRQDLCRKNTLIDLSKTTIKNTSSNKGSFYSIKTINKILDILDDKSNKANLTLKKENKKLDLFKKEEHIKSVKDGFITEKIKKLDISNKNRLIINNNNCISDRNNNKKRINIKKSLITKNSTEKGKKTEKNSKNNLIEIMKNQYIINQLNIKKQFNKLKLHKMKKNIISKNNKNIRKLSITNNIANNNTNNNDEIKSLIRNKKNGSKKIIQMSNAITLKANKVEEETGNFTDRERRNHIPNMNKIHNSKALPDNKLQTFLKIALNFNKSPLKKRTTLFYKKKRNKDSKISFTDRYKNRSNKLKTKINLNADINSNLTEYIKCNKKKSLNTLGNKSKKMAHLSRNYKIGFEDIKTKIVKTTLQNTKFRETLNANGYNSSKKKLAPFYRFKINNKNSYSKNKTRKIIKSKENTNSYVKKEKGNLTSFNSNHLYSRTNNCIISNYKTINVKKSLLPLNRIILMGLGLSNNHTIRKQTTLSKINIPFI